MNEFSISQLSRYSGIKAHTIRIWEQRYNALQPGRTEGNTRFYNGGQLRRLLNIVSLQQSGFKVSELCSYTDKKLHELVGDELLKATNGDESAEYFISQLVAAGISFDEQLFDKMFAACHVRMGIRDSYVRVIYPLLARVGLLWQQDNFGPSSEHFITNLLRQKIFTAIDALPPPTLTNEKWLLFLREGEHHEIGLLVASYMIRRSSRPVIYLGNDLPLFAIEDAVKATRPGSILTFLVHNDAPDEIEEFIKSLTAITKDKKVVVACHSSLVTNVRSKKVSYIHHINELEGMLESAT